jgi:hypothetical protein
MVVATVNLQDTETINLKSLPGGYVTLRRLSYGQILERRAMTAGMKVRASKGKDFEGELQTMNERVTLFEFQNCVVDHNLTDAQENKLDLHNPLGVKSLDPRVGQEIEGLFNDLNNFEDDEDAEGNSSLVSDTTTSRDEPE